MYKKFKPKVICVVEDINFQNLGKIYSVTDIIEAGSLSEMYYLEDEFGKTDVAYSDLFISLDKWREIQLNKLGI